MLTIYVLVVAGAAVFVLSIIAAPWFANRGFPTAAYAIYTGFHSACHQLPERSFWLFGAPLAVCARCFGLYLGGFAGLLAIPLLRGLDRPSPPRRWLVVAAIPTAVDFTLGWSGLWDNTAVSRGTTGFVLGAVAAFYVMPGLLEAAMMLWSRATSKEIPDARA